MDRTTRGVLLGTIITLSSIGFTLISLQKLVPATRMTKEEAQHYFQAGVDEWFEAGEKFDEIIEEAQGFSDDEEDE